MTTHTNELTGDEIKAYRVRGGAIVRVIRGARVRRYKVSGRRFVSLRRWANGQWTPRGGWGGYYGSSTLDLHRFLSNPA